MIGDNAWDVTVVGEILRAIGFLQKKSDRNLNTVICLCVRGGAGSFKGFSPFIRFDSSGRFIEIAVG